MRCDICFKKIEGDMYGAVRLEGHNHVFIGNKKGLNFWANYFTSRQIVILKRIYTLHYEEKVTGTNLELMKPYNGPTFCLGCILLEKL